MAKDWAKSFYESKAWQDTRDYMMSKNNYICQKCKEKPAEIVHHIIWLNPININDPKISLSEENLMPVCRDCHAEIHHKDPVTIEGLCFDEHGQLIRR